MSISAWDESSRRGVRRTGWFIALAVIGLFVATLLVKWVGLLPAPTIE